MSSTNAEPSPPQDGSPKKGLAAQLKSLDWKKDKKRILLIAAGGVLAVVIVVLIPSGGADANVDTVSQMKSNPIQALQSMAAKVRPDLEIASVDGTAQTVTLRDKSGALSTFKFDPQNKTLVLVPVVQPKAAEDPPPLPEQAAAELPGWMPVYPATSPKAIDRS
jgi:hypothetical protein